MATRQLALTPDEDALVDGLVASGRYANADEAARAAFRLLEKDEAEWLAFLERLNGAYDRAKAGVWSSRTWEEIKERTMRRARGE